MNESSALFNGSMIKFDPYTNTTLEIINFPGITEVYDEHASGIHWDSRTKLVSIVIDAQPAFLTNGANASGDYWLIKYSPLQKKEVWRANLTALTNAKWSGFQDVTVSSDGYSFVVGTYPKSIIRVDPSGKELVAWYPPQTTNTSVHGFTGVASLGDGNTLIAIDANDVPEDIPSGTGNSQLYRFDMSSPKGIPKIIPRFPEGITLGVPDAIFLPRKYHGRVLLAVINYVGVTVLVSKDNWNTAHQMGTIRSEFPEFFKRIVTATVQVGDEKLFLLGQYFPGSIVPGTKGGNQSVFPVFDITGEVDALVNKGYNTLSLLM